MKIRTGFISNSSTSSYLALGWDYNKNITGEQVREIIKILSPEALAPTWIADPQKLYTELSEDELVDEAGDIFSELDLEVDIEEGFFGLLLLVDGGEAVVEDLVKNIQEETIVLKKISKILGISKEPKIRVYSRYT